MKLQPFQDDGTDIAVILCGVACGHERCKRILVPNARVIECEQCGIQVYADPQTVALKRNRPNTTRIMCNPCGLAEGAMASMSQGLSFLPLLPVSSHPLIRSWN